MRSKKHSFLNFSQLVNLVLAASLVLAACSTPSAGQAPEQPAIQSTSASQNQAAEDPTQTAGSSDSAQTTPTPETVESDPFVNVTYTSDILPGESHHQIAWPANTGGDPLNWHYLLYVPPARPNGLMVFLHGQDQNGIDFCNEINAIGHAERLGFVAACPTANNFAWQQPLDNEAGFVMAVINEIRSHIEIPPGRIYVTGFSSGGALTYKMACTASDVIAGFAVLGSPWPPVDQNDGQAAAWAQECGPAALRPLWVGMGAQDSLFPDQAANLQGWRTFSSEILGFGGTETEFLNAKGVVCVELYGSILVSAPGKTRYCTYDQLEHKWPGDQSGLDAIPAIWEFMLTRGTR